MDRLSTIPITLDPSIYRPQVPARTDADSGKGKRRPTITLAPAVYNPSASRKRSAADGYRPRLPPKSPWPVLDGSKDGSRRPEWATGRKASDTPAPIKSHSAPPSRQSSFYTEAAPVRPALSNPPSRKGTPVAAPPRRPTIEGSALEKPRAPPRRPSVPTSLTSDCFSQRPQQPSDPERKSSTSSSSSTLSSDTSTLTPPPPAAPHPRGPGPNLQTRYMTMLLALDSIPRLHNILAPLFGWLMLAGFIVLPGALAATSPQQEPAGRTSALLLLPDVHTLLAILAAASCGVGCLGVLWLGLRWASNHVWLVNRVYLPGVLHASAGLIAALTDVYARRGGQWAAPAAAVVGLEAAALLAFLALFVVYNCLLLDKVKKMHRLEVVDGAGREDKVAGRGHHGASWLKGKVGRAVRQPSFAPGSVV